jgi:hypothetical protein
MEAADEEEGVITSENEMEESEGELAVEINTMNDTNNDNDDNDGGNGAALGGLSRIDACTVYIVTVD